MKVKPSTISKTLSKFLIFFLLIQLIAGIFLFVPRPQEAKANGTSWYNSSWFYRKQLTFDNSGQSENLTNFPISVHLTSSNFDFTKARDNGEDIRFIDSDGTTLLKYEIEKWDKSGQDANIWVKVPQIDSSSATDSIYIYYGNSSASDGQDVENVWDGNYRGVYHMSGGATASVLDSTNISNDGAKKAIGEPINVASGKIAGAQDFDGTDDYIDFGTGSFATSQGTLIEGFENVSNWTLFNGTGSSKENDTTHIKGGSQSVKFNLTGGNGATWDKNISLSLSSPTNIIFWVYVSDATKTGSISVYLSSSPWSKYFVASISTAYFKTGWNRFVISTSNFSNTGGESWNNTMTRMRITLGVASGQDISYSLDDMRYNYDGQAKVIISFDDGHDTDYTKAYPILSGNNQKAVSFVITDYVGVSGMTNKTQLEDLQAHGWDISNHTKSHPDLTTLSAEDLNTQINGAYDWLVNNGFSQGAKFLAYPGGAYNDDVINMVKQNHVIARTVKTGYREPHFQLNNDNIQYTTKIHNVYQGVTVQSVKNNIDSVAVQKGLLILLFHGIVDSIWASTQYLTADFQEISDYLRTKEDAGALNVITFSDYYNQISKLSFDDNISIEAWVNPDTWATEKSVFERYHETSGLVPFSIIANSDGSTMSAKIYTTDATSTTISFGAISADTWSHLVATYDGSTVKTYVNGVLQNSAALTGNISPNEWNLYVGKRNSDYWSGSMDEIRLSNAARSADWVHAQYLSMNGGFVSFGTEDGYPIVPIISIPTGLSPSSMRWNFTDNNSYETGFNLYDNNGNLATTSATANLTYLDETGLSENTQYTGRYVKAYNTYGSSSASSTAASKYTLADTPTNLDNSATRDSISLTVDSFPNASSGSSGYYFYRTDDSSRNSGWIQKNNWTDTGLTCGSKYTYGVKYRNGDSVETSAATLSQNTEPCVSEGGASENDNIDKEATPTVPKKTDLNPQGDFSIVVNGDAEYTNSRTVKLKLFAGSDTKYMLLSENTNFSGAVQEKYVPDKIWTLSKGDGKKTIYAKFLTLYDVASKTVSDSIILDTTAPNLSITDPQNYSSLTDDTPTIKGTSEPDASIVLELQTEDGAQSYYSTETDKEGNWEYTFLSPLKNGDYTLNITSQDQVGNLSKAQTIHFKIQTQKVSLKPEIPALTPPISPPSKEEEPTPTETPLPSKSEEQGAPEEQEEPTPPSAPEKQASLPPSDLQPNVPFFESLYGNISLKPASPETPLTLISGQKLKSFVKPKKPVKAIKVTIIFQKPAEKDTSYETKHNLLSSLIGIPSAQAQTWRIAEYTLTDENNDGIYEGEITLPQTTGTYLIRTTLFYTDGTLENLDTETLIDPKGYIYTPASNNQQTRINKAAISLYVFNANTNEFEVWDSTKYDQQNPQETDQTGEYEFLVPEGKYYLQITAKGYQPYKGEEFQAQEGDVIHQNIELAPVKKFNLKWLILPGIIMMVLIVGVGIGFWKKGKPILVI